MQLEQLEAGLARRWSRRRLRLGLGDMVLRDRGGARVFGDDVVSMRLEDEVNDVELRGDVKLESGSTSSATRCNSMAPLRRSVASFRVRASHECAGLASASGNGGDDSCSFVSRPSIAAARHSIARSSSYWAILAARWASARSICGGIIPLGGVRVDPNADAGTALAELFLMKDKKVLRSGEKSRGSGKREKLQGREKHSGLRNRRR